MSHRLVLRLSEILSLHMIYGYCVFLLLLFFSSLARGIMPGSLRPDRASLRNDKWWLRGWGESWEWAKGAMGLQVIETPLNPRWAICFCLNELSAISHSDTRLDPFVIQFQSVWMMLHLHTHFKSTSVDKLENCLFRWWTQPWVVTFDRECTR